MAVKRVKFLVFISLIGLLNSCQHFIETIKFDLDLEFKENNNSLILFETEPGCLKTNFKFTDEFHKGVELKQYNYFMASNFDEYENTIKKYFEMDFLDTVTQEYFKRNNLIILVLSLNDEDNLKNYKFTKNNDNKYTFEMELWDNGTPLLFRKKCVYFKILVLEIPK